MRAGLFAGLAVVFATGCSQVAIADDDGETSPVQPPPPRGCHDGLVAPGEWCFSDPSIITLVQPSTELAIGDTDGNGEPEIVVAGTVVTLHGSGVADPGREPIDLEGQAHAMAIADVDAGGVKDIIVVTEHGVHAFLNGATISVHSTNVAVRSPTLATGDFDQDGRTDIVAMGGTDHQAAIWYGNGTGAFSRQQDLDVLTASGKDITVADFNGDGLDDIAVSTIYWHMVVVQYGLGGGQFSMPTLEEAVTVVPGNWAIASGDLDGDGDIDFVAPGVSGDHGTIALNDGHGSYLTDDFVTHGAGAADVALADLNTDGHLDMLTANSGDLSILVGVGDGTFADPVAQLPGVPLSRIAVGDLNGDTVPDVAALTSDTVWRVHVLLSTP